MVIYFMHGLLHSDQECGTGAKVIYHYHIWKVVPDKSQIIKEYLYLLLDWDTEKIKADQGTGTTMMHVGKGSMEARVVPDPPTIRTTTNRIHPRRGFYGHRQGQSQCQAESKKCQGAF